VITPLRHLGMARVLKGYSHSSYLHTPHTSANGMNHTCLRQETCRYLVDRISPS